MAQPVKHYGKWRIRYLDGHGKRRSENCDTRHDALFKLRQAELEAEEIRRGLRSPTPIEKTFSELCDYWLMLVVPCVS